MTASTQPDAFAHPKIPGGSNPLRAGWDSCTLEIGPLPLADKGQHGRRDAAASALGRRVFAS